MGKRVKYQMPKILDISQKVGSMVYGKDFTVEPLRMNWKKGHNFQMYRKRITQKKG